MFRSLADFDGRPGAFYGDRIDDFSRAQGDRLDLSTLGDPTFIVTEAFSSSGVGEIRLIRGNSSPVLIDGDGDGTADAVLQLNRFYLQAGDLIF